jgi:hypothetical protein
VVRLCPASRVLRRRAHKGAGNVIRPASGTGRITVVRLPSAGSSTGSRRRRPDARLGQCSGMTPDGAYG